MPGAFVVLALLHWLTPVVRSRLHDDPGDEFAQLGGRLQLATPAWLWGATMVLHDFEADHAGVVVAAGVAGAAALMAFSARTVVPQWLWTSQLLGASVVLSVGLISWLDGSTLVGALAVQAVAMLALSVAIDDTWFTWQSIITAGVVWLAGLGLTLEALEEDAAWGADAVHGLVFGATLGIGWYLRERLEGHGIHTVQDLLAKDAKELSTIPGIGPVTAQKLLDTATETLEENLAEAAETAVGEE